MKPFLKYCMEHKKAWLQVSFLQNKTRFKIEDDKRTLIDYYEKVLVPHFEEEEKDLKPGTIVGERILADHKMMADMIDELKRALPPNDYKILNLFCRVLQQHIVFEENAKIPRC